MKIYIIGSFFFPHGRAAAQFMLEFGCMVKKLNYEVVFIDLRDDGGTWESDKYLVNTISCSKKDRYLSSGKIIKLLEANSVICMYNYPLVPSVVVYLWGKIHSCIILPIVTEWYVLKKFEGGIFARLFKYIDIQGRMRALNKFSDGLVICSSYLDKYYKKQCTFIIPTLVNYKYIKSFLKENTARINDGIKRFVYCGSPGKYKDDILRSVNLIYKAGEATHVKYKLIIIGISLEEYCRTYNIQSNDSSLENCVFTGRIPYEECLKIEASCDYSLIIRNKYRNTNAGFPTKFAESIACGTPVIVTDVSDLVDYINEGENGYVISFNDDEAVKKLCTIMRNSDAKIIRQKKICYEEKTFSSSRYSLGFKNFLEKILMGKI